jgi:hypothetical protein
MAASMKFRFVFWNVLPCKIIVHRHFRGTCCLHHRPDDGGSTYLWNVDQQLFYMAVHPRRQIWTSVNTWCAFPLKSHSFLQYLVGSLFNGSFSVTRLHSFDDRMISEWWWIGKDLVGSSCGLILTFYPGIHLEGLIKPRQTSIRIAGHQGQVSNLGPPEYEAGVLSTQPQRTVLVSDVRWICDQYLIRYQYMKIQTDDPHWICLHVDLTLTEEWWVNCCRVC